MKNVSFLYMQLLTIIQYFFVTNSTTAVYSNIQNLIDLTNTLILAQYFIRTLCKWLLGSNKCGNIFT